MRAKLFLGGRPGGEANLHVAFTVLLQEAWEYARSASDRWALLFFSFLKTRSRGYLGELYRMKRISTVFFPHRIDGRRYRRCFF